MLNGNSLSMTEVTKLLPSEYYARVIDVFKFEIMNFIWCTNSFSIIIKNVIVNAVFTVIFKINIQNVFFM